MIAKELFKGTIRTIVLQLLAEHRKMYGYEIMQTIEKKSDGRIKLTFGSLYPILHKLESEGLIFSESETIGKRVRKYYILTDQGVKEKESKVLQIKEFINTLNQLLDSGGVIHGDPEGLRSFAKLLNDIADLNQEEVDDNDLPIGAREHFHLRPKFELANSSDTVIVGRLDAKGTGVFYDRFIPKDNSK